MEEFSFPVFWLVAMAFCAMGSAFFSLCESALFSLDQRQREELGRGSRAQRLSGQLLENPERLLSAILFCNLVFNVTYFATSSLISFQMEERGRSAEAVSVALGALVGLIVLCEMLPKSVAVLCPKFWTGWVAYPLALSVGLVEKFVPLLVMVTQASIRVFWPRFESEAYLQVEDLRRVVEWTRSHRLLLSQEQAALESLVQLSEIRADELMRPRRRLRSFRPPVYWADLHGQEPEDGLVVITERDSDELAGVVSLENRWPKPEEPLERWAEPLVFVPWCATAAQVLQQLLEQKHPAAAVVNEYGETIGLLTRVELLKVALASGLTRRDRPSGGILIRQTGPETWQVAGTASVRRVARLFAVTPPPTKAVTLSGLFQELLGRFPQVGDACDWGPFKMKVIDAPDRGDLLVEFRYVGDEAHGRLND